MNAMTAFFLAFACLVPQPPAGDEAVVKERLDRVRAIHGGTGPWAVLGYRMGERAMKELDLPPQSFGVKVTHRGPAEVQYSCMADGLQAATGASPGKLNLVLEDAERDELASMVEDRKTGRKLRFVVKPELAKSITDLPFDKLAAEGERIARLPDDDLFTVVESK